MSIHLSPGHSLDTITQAVLGAAVAEAGWRKGLGSKAVIFGAVCGLIPDLDVVAGVFGPWASMTHHRALTHSVIFAPVVSPALGWLAWKWAKGKGSPRQWGRLAFWGLITHPLLDVFTSYGTQLLWPFSRARFALDGVSIIDPIYTFTLMAALMIAWRARARPEIGQWAARLGLTLTTLYLLMGYGLSQRAQDEAIAAAPPAFAPSRARATPTFGNLALWRVMLANQKGDVQVGYTSHLTDVPITWSRAPRSKDSRVDAALGHPHGQLFLWFTDGWLSSTVSPGERGSAIIQLRDVRYGGVLEPAKGLWAAEFTVDDSGRVTSSRQIRPQEAQDLDMGAELKAQWNMIWGRPAP